MSRYVARFSIKLKVPIDTSESTLPPLLLRSSTGYVHEVTLRGEPANGLVKVLDVEAVYEGHDVQHLCHGPEAPPEEGVQVGVLSPRMQFFLPPWEIGKDVIRHMLYHLSGLTLQSHLYWRLEEEIKEYASEYTWELPDGRIVPPIDPVFPFYALPELHDTGRRAMNATDWTEIQKIFDGTGAGSPLWQAVLAEAHRERENDPRNVVVRCATAIDLAVQPFLPPDDTVSLKVFRGEVGKARDLRAVDAALYTTISRLWYTRHGVVHKGRLMLYDGNSRTHPPLRPLKVEDVEDFLRCVPRAVAFIESNPPF